MNSQLPLSHLNILKNTIFHTRLHQSKKRIIATCILSISLGFSLKSQALDAQNISALNQGEVRLLHVGESYRFVDAQNNPLTPKNFTKHALLQRLNLTKKVHDEAIVNIQKNAYRELRGKLEPHISEEYLSLLFTNYVDEENVQETIDITGSSPSTKEAKNFNHYMMLCDAVYTNFSTRAFVMQQNLATVGRNLCKISERFQEARRLCKNIQSIRDNQDALIRRNPIFEANGGPLGHVEQVRALPREQVDPDIEKNYWTLIRNTNEFLLSLGRESECIVDNDLNPLTLQNKLTDLRNDIEENYYWYFEKEARNPRDWAVEMDTQLSLDRIPMFNEQQLTPKAVIGFSFLNQAGLLDNDNITLIDVGFRNQTKFGSAWNTFATALMNGRANPEAWFQKWGEVDYIAYIEKDSSPVKKDKLFVVYSGSNSEIDWGIDLTIGNNAYLGIAVHQGIGWLSEMSNRNYQPILMQRIRNFYKRNAKPSELEIITTGHSLGGALAELSAYCYKTKLLNEFKDIVGAEGIKIKTYTFGTPAVVDENSKRTIEGALGRENIFRIWTYGDPVADDVKRSTLSLIERLRFRGLELIGSKHIGRSFVLYNIQNHKFGFVDWWGKHSAERYRSYLHHLDSPDYTQQISKFEEELNNYIRIKGLFGYKKHKNRISNITQQLTTGTLPASVVLDTDLAKRIVKYSPTTLNLKPPHDVEEALQSTLSPRYAASLSPRFTVEESGELYSYGSNNPTWRIERPLLVRRTSNILYDRHEVTATFRIEGQVIDFPIYKSTPCTIQYLKKFLEGKRIFLTEEDIQPFSCGAYLAKHIFVSQYITQPSYYHGLAGKMYAHLDTLTKIFQGCLKENACTPQYLVETSRNNTALKQALVILTRVGLGEAFRKKRLNFSRFNSQDMLLGDVRHGKDIVESYTPSLKFDRDLIGRLIKNIDITAPEQSDIFNNERQYLFNQLAYATYTSDHWNRFSCFFDVDEFRSLLSCAEGNRGPQYRIQLFNNFHSNLLNIFNLTNLNNNSTNCYFTRPRLDLPTLLDDLARLKGEVVVAS